MPNSDEVGAGVGYVHGSGLYYKSGMNVNENNVLES